MGLNQIIGKTLNNLLFGTTNDKNKNPIDEATEANLVTENIHSTSKNLAAAIEEILATTWVIQVCTDCG